MVEHVLHLFCAFAERAEEMQDDAGVEPSGPLRHRNAVEGGKAHAAIAAAAAFDAAQAGAAAEMGNDHLAIRYSGNLLFQRARYVTVG